MTPSTRPASRLRPVWRTIAWLGLSAAQIFDYILIHNMVMKFAQLWYDDAVTKLLTADPRSATTQLDFVMKMVYFFTMFILAILAVSFTIYLEHYFQQGDRKNILGQRVVRVAAIEAGIAAAAVLVVFLLNTFA